LDVRSSEFKACNFAFCQLAQAWANVQACVPLKKARYINQKIELELVDFKKEIEEKFYKS